MRAKVAAAKGDIDVGESLAREAVAQGGGDGLAAPARRRVRGARRRCMAATGRAKDAKKAARQALALYEAKGSVAAADALRARFET